MAAAKAFERLQAEVLETYKQQKVQLIEGFLKDVSGQLYGLVYDAVRQLLDAEGFSPAKPGDLQEVLKDIGTASRYMLLSIGETPRPGRAVGIKDDVPDELFRCLRRRARQEQTASGQVDLSDLESTGRRTRHEESSVA